MSDWSTLINAALINGVWLALSLVTVMLISGRVAPDMWVGDYPPDIREKYGPMSARSARIRPYFAVLFFGIVILVPLLGLFALRDQLGQLSFAQAAAFAGLAVFVFNLFDLLILDWLFFCTIQPRVMVLPGTEGMAGYRDYRFHFIGFLKGLGFCLGGGLLIGGLWLLLQLIGL